MTTKRNTVCSHMSRYVAKALKPAQGKWNRATQQRISVINSMLGSIKNVKMLGLQRCVATQVEDLRNQEMCAAAGVRWLFVAYNTSGKFRLVWGVVFNTLTSRRSANALGMFAPVLTIVVYAAVMHSRGEGLDVETTFTSIAILAMITHPANMVMTMVPRAVISYASFERVQTYLLGERSLGALSGSDDSPSCPPAKPENGVAISLEHVGITYSTTTKLILQDINVKIPQGSITVLTGPVGSGKTTLARAILDEITPSRGSVRVSLGSVAYCSQSPWLPNQSIKNAICGPAALHETCDEAWYQKSLQACCLDADIDAFPEGDSTLVGSKGMNISGGQRQRVALARAVYSRAEVVVLDDSFNALDGKTQGQVIENLLGKNGIFKQPHVTVVWCTTNTGFFRLADEVIVLSDGMIKEKGTWDQLRKDDPLLDDILRSHGKASDEAAQTPKEKQDCFVTKSAGGGVTGDLARKNGDLSLYSYYCRAAGLMNIATLASCAILYGFFITFPPYWLKWWTESPSSSGTGFYMAGYLALLLLAYTTTIYGIYITVLHIAPTSGLTLHHRLLSAVVGAPLLYFSEINTGTILNRFSEDIQLVDKTIADAWSTLNIQVFKLLVQACLVFASQPLMTLSLPFSVVMVYVVQKVYLRTSRQLRILELESRAAVFSSFLETVQGAATIRAFGWGAAAARENMAILDGSQRPFYLLFCLRRWLNVVLDLLIAGIAVGTIWLAVVFRGSTTGGQVGVALNVILIANSTLLKLVESWTNLEISLGAVARLKEVDTTTPSEEQHPEGTCDSDNDDNDNDHPPRHWPSEGAIAFNNIRAAYHPEMPVLNNLSLSIEPGQTVVICGRTGSGKSSLLLALLRLLDLTEGSITIDGVNIARVPSKSTLRERAFITVAQEAFFLPQASLRFNLDPEQKADPHVMVSALARTGLWGHFCAHRRRGIVVSPTTTSPPALGSRPGRGQGERDPLLLPSSSSSSRARPVQQDGDEESNEETQLLSTPLESLPTLSAGQTQLLALTRALVRKHVLTTTANNNINLVSQTYTTFPNPNDREGRPSPLLTDNNIHATTTNAKPIILLDEVTSSLDPVTEAKIYDVLEQDFVAQGHTVVMVTHKVQGIRGRLRRGRDVIVWMAGGRISATSDGDGDYIDGCEGSANKKVIDR